MCDLICDVITVFEAVIRVKSTQLKKITLKIRKK